jgi:hypothetical protein
MAILLMGNKNMETGPQQRDVPRARTPTMKRVGWSVRELNERWTARGRGVGCEFYERWKRVGKVGCDLIGTIQRDLRAGEGHAAHFLEHAAGQVYARIGIVFGRRGMSGVGVMEVVSDLRTRIVMEGAQNRVDGKEQIGRAQQRVGRFLKAMEKHTCL